MEILHYWRVIRKSIWLIVLMVALSTSAMAVYTVNQRPEYQSTATLLLNPAVPSSLVPFVQTQLAANLADSYTQLMHTYSFGESVVKELPFPFSADRVGTSISTTLEPNTLFYRISARMDTPEQAQQLVDTIVKVFLSANASQQAGTNADNLKDDMRQRLQIKLDVLDNQIKSYQDQLDTLAKQPASPQRDDLMFQMQGRLDSLQQADTNTMLALAQIGANNQAANTALVIDHPRQGTQIPQPLTRNLLLALLVALPIGMGLAFLRHNLDNTIHSPEELKQFLGVMPVTAIGIVGESHRRRGYALRGKRGTASPTKVPDELHNKNLVVIEHPHSPESESFRILRTNIQFSSLDKPIRSLVVTSAGPTEGKSFTASNLAIAMAQAGKRVILVDCDLRKPSLHRIFGLDNTSGFTNLLMQDEKDGARIVRQVPGIENLSLITSGPLPPNPSELLNSNRASQMIEYLGRHAAMVIFDAPPAGAVTDPAILATQVDAVVLVVSAGHTRIDIIEPVVQALQNVGVSTVLPVLNRVKLGDLNNYYSYRYYYSEEGKTADNSAAGYTNGRGPAPAKAAAAASDSAQDTER